MNAGTRSTFALLLLPACLTAWAEQFVFEARDPAFRVSIPNIPPMKMAVHPLHGGQPHFRYLGEEGPYSIAILTLAAGPGATIADCASTAARAVSADGGVQDVEIFKVPLNPNAMVLIYAVPRSGFVQLHAHFLSPAGTQCVEVHASKVSVSPEDAAPWFKGFGSATIEMK